MCLCSALCMYIEGILVCKAVLMVKHFGISLRTHRCLLVLSVSMNTFQEAFSLLTTVQFTSQENAQLLRQTGMLAHWLPPYSPDMSPIEFLKEKQ